MESSIAKAYSKRLLKELTGQRSSDSKSLAEIAHFVEGPARSVSVKNKLLDGLLRDPPPAYFHMLSFGNKNKRYLCYGEISRGDFNPWENQDEDSILAKSRVISTDQRNSTDLEVIAFVVVRHAMERFFKRSSLSINDPFISWRDAFKYELNALHFYQILASTLCSGAPSMDGLSLSLYMPTENGAFIGYMEGITLNIRTYIAKEDMTPQQKEGWSTIYPLASAFSKTPIHFVWAIETNPLNNASLLAQHVRFSILLLQAILPALKTDIIEGLFAAESELSRHIILEWSDTFFPNTANTLNKSQSEPVISMLNDGGFQRMFHHKKTH